MTFFESLSSDCSDTSVESSSEEEMSINDLSVASSAGVQNAENVDSSSVVLNVEVKKHSECGSVDSSLLFQVFV
ncbi:hypothetical protein NPIL_625531 [Nephila pilipes]|uniref:Uncharacterized protein n=1 Tax=Nephila pilipes TaxID=299642 RepID=A0A8X6PMY3_NEPPI|nr:hypothetical protein NPIL_625531 [Nephila pilipes]